MAPHCAMRTIRSDEVGRMEGTWREGIVGDIDCGIEITNFDIRCRVAVICGDCVERSDVLPKEALKFILREVNHVCWRVLKERFSSVIESELI